MTGWDDPNSDPMQDMRDFNKQAEDSYDNIRLPERIPLDLAIKQVAAQTGVPEHQIQQYAERMQQHSTLGGALIAGGGLGAALKAAANFELAARKVAAAMNQPADVVRAKMLEMAKASIRPVEDQCPHNPANRRTFRLAGKPYHYVQAADGRLHTEPGESPWI